MWSVIASESDAEDEAGAADSFDGCLNFPTAIVSLCEAIPLNCAEAVVRIIQMMRLNEHLLKPANRSLFSPREKFHSFVRLYYQTPHDEPHWIATSDGRL